uniref:TGF-beta family profile domain-containing protein n=1 Tax=Equus caballus TaxID=9796 RepID=F6TRN4_HORSE
MAARPSPLWLLGLALCALGGGGPGPRPPPGCPPRRLGPRERRDLQREILEVLGLPGRPRPRTPPAAARPPASAPLFMLDLYHAMAGDDAEDGGPPERRLGHADLVMSFVNMGLSVDPGLAGLLGQRAPRSKQPFMVTFFRASPRPVRAPRAVRPLKRRPPKKTNELPHPNKLPGIFDDVHGSDGRQVCRRHELYVSFQDLGWLDWVIAPQGYSAYYCEGECSFPLDSCMNATNHAILQSLVHLMKPDAVPKACCAPTKLSATSVLYYDSSNNVILRKHRNMVVRACGCH